MYWEHSTDSFKFKTKLNFSQKYRKVKTGPDMTRSQLKEFDLRELSKRSVLSQISGIYDPLGLLIPFTVTAKVMMQQLWKDDAKELGWDDVLPKHIATKWMQFFEDMFEVEKYYHSNDALDQKMWLISQCPYYSAMHQKKHLVPALIFAGNILMEA